MRNDISRQLLHNEERRIENRFVKLKLDIIDTLISSIEDEHPETGGHGMRVGFYAGLMC